jgi:hypothetical protein
MKTITFIILTMSSFFTFSQGGEFGINVPVDVPFKSVMPYMGTNVGFGMNFAYSPIPGSPLYIEFKPSWGMYYSKTLQQTYTFDDSSSTITDVNYTSGLQKYLLGAKVMIGHEYRSVRGFITPQIGLGRARTKIFIADPEDEDGCRPLESRNTQKFTSGVYGGEVGVEFDLYRLFPNFLYENKHNLVIAGTFLAGFKHFEYVNVEYMQNESHSTDVSHDDRDINATFINVGSNALHEHKIAELYHTPLRMWGISIGYTINF